MNKLISAVILATFTAVASFGCHTKMGPISQEPPASTSKKVEHKKKETVKEPPADTRKKEEVKYEAKPDSASAKDDEMMREKSLSEREREYKDQEVMDKKPYKQ